MARTQRTNRRMEHCRVIAVPSRNNSNEKGAKKLYDIYSVR